MSGSSHPFATGGGGTVFEYRVATLLAADMICSRQTEHGGAVVSLELQSGPAGFDDVQLAMELPDGGSRIVSAQCRNRQPFTTSNAKFGALLEQALDAVDGEPSTFGSGAQRLAVVVDSYSPGHASMAQLCDLARTSGDFERFEDVVRRHGGEIMRRWGHCVAASSAVDARAAHRILVAMEVRAVELSSPASRDSVEFVNRLASLWSPVDLRRAGSLALALFVFITDRGPSAGQVDIQVLKRELGSVMPGNLASVTRREALGRLRTAGELRVRASMQALGLDEATAARLAADAIGRAPTVEIRAALAVVYGAMGVGKTTELERLHRVAIERALDDPLAPIPVFVHAREVAHSSLRAVAQHFIAGLGDPSLCGVHLTVDGLDEAGVRIHAVVGQVATLTATWPNSVVVLGTRDRPEGSDPPAVEIGPLTQQEAAALIESIHPEAGRWEWWRTGLTDVLRRPLFAIRFALDRRLGLPSGRHLGELVRSVGEYAVRELADASDDAFDLVVAAACAVVASGGSPVHTSSLNLSPAQSLRLSQLRMVQVVDQRVSFHLAVLTEWFAAHAVLTNPTVLEQIADDSSRAHRWRYALGQAVLQGNAEQVDRVLAYLFARVPGLAAVVVDDVAPAPSASRSGPAANSALEAGHRIRRATESMTSPWTVLSGRWSFDPGPTLGVSLSGNWISTAWDFTRGESGEDVVVLPDNVNPLGPRVGAWRMEGGCIPVEGHVWPWAWSLTRVSSELEQCVVGRQFLGSITACHAELAWDFAHRVLGKSPDVQSAPVEVSRAASGG